MLAMYLTPILFPKLSKSPDKIRDSSLTNKFPVKFWKIVNSSKTNAVCWGFGGNTIRIFKEKFEEEYLLGENRPFKTVTFNSFIRQLNLYGFRKVIRPVITNEHGQRLNTSLLEYRHPLFLQGHPELLTRIKRNTNSKKAKDKQTAEQVGSGQRTGNIGQTCFYAPVQNGGSLPTPCYPPLPSSIASLSRQSQVFGPPVMVPSQTSIVPKDNRSTSHQQGKPELKCGQLYQNQKVTFYQENIAPGHPNQISGQRGISEFRSTTATYTPKMLTESVSSKTSNIVQDETIGYIKPIQLAPNAAKLMNEAYRHSTAGFYQQIATSEIAKFQPLNATFNAKITNLQQTNEITPRNTTIGLQPGHLYDNNQPIISTFKHVSGGMPKQNQILNSGSDLQKLTIIGNGSFQGSTVIQANHVIQTNQLNQANQLNMSSVHQPQTLSIYHNPSSNPNAMPLSLPCTDVARHPLLQAVRQERSTPSARPSKKSSTTTASNSSSTTVSNSSNRREEVDLSKTCVSASVPEDSEQAAEDSSDFDVLTQLPLFKLSSDLKDIDAPQLEDLFHGNLNPSVEAMDSMSASAGINSTHQGSMNPAVETNSVSGTLDHAASGTMMSSSCEDSMKMNELLTENNQGDMQRYWNSNYMQINESEQSRTMEVDSSEDNNKVTDNDHTTPSTDMLLSNIVSQITSVAKGPRRELFKDDTKRITIPLSGLPKELFKFTSSTGSSKNEAVVTIETSDDGRISGHLILPGNDVRAIR